MGEAARTVLLVMYGWDDSGGGTMLPRAFAHELAQQGDRVIVFSAAARRSAELPDYGTRVTDVDGVLHIALHNRRADFMATAAPLDDIDDPGARSAFAAVLDDHRPDVVHFWNLHGLSMALPAECKTRSIPTVLSTNNYWSICPRLYLVSERLERCDGPSACGTRCRTCLGEVAPAAEYGDRRAAGVRMLRSGIDLHLAVSRRVRDLHVQNGDDPDHVRVLAQEPPNVTAIWERTGSTRALGCPSGRPLRVGFIGSVMPHKGVHVLAAALQRLPVGAVEAVALGDVTADYLQVLQGIDPAGRLQLTGRYDAARLPELLAALDVVVVPSVWDDCAPFVVAEALAARCPVVGARIGGIPDFVTDGENGLLCAPGDAEGLARALTRLVEDRELLPQLQLGIAPPRGLARFTADVRECYAELTGTGRRAAGSSASAASATAMAEASSVSSSPCEEPGPAPLPCS